MESKKINTYANQAYSKIFKKYFPQITNHQTTGLRTGNFFTNIMRIFPNLISIVIPARNEVGNKNY